MTRRRVRTVYARGAAREARPVAAVIGELVHQQLTDPAGVPPETRHARALVETAVANAPATQVRRPWRATLRTAFQAVVALAAMLPLLVGASGLDETAGPVVGVLAIAAGLTRVMALPDVEEFLQRFAPWLAAAPPPK